MPTSTTTCPVGRAADRHRREGRRRTSVGPPGTRCTGRRLPASSWRAGAGRLVRCHRQRAQRRGAVHTGGLCKWRHQNVRPAGRGSGGALGDQCRQGSVRRAGGCCAGWLQFRRDLSFAMQICGCFNGLWCRLCCPHGACCITCRPQADALTCLHTRLRPNRPQQPALLLAAV